ncbi:MAG: DUF421 domain-containing protein [Acetanaerobacterium sp.]
MELFSDIAQTFIRAVGAIAFLFLLTKLMGAKQISQMTFFDYIIGISIGSIVGIVSIDREIHFAHPLTTMTAYALADVCIGFATRKSIWARRAFTGKPSIVIYNGKIIRQNMKRMHFDINELLSMCRIKGYYNVADIHCAIIETNGDLSVLPNSERRPVQPADLDLVPEQESLVANVVIDGKIMKENLNGIGKNERWLEKKLHEQNVKDVAEVLLATCDDTGALSVYRMDESPPRGGILD